MPRTVPALLLAVAMLFAGCAGAPAGTATESPTDTATDSPTDGPPVSAEYVVRGGTLPDEVASATATVRVVFVQETDDLGPCYPEVFSGPYKPTITPLPTPSGECYRSETVKVDLTGDGRILTFEHEAPVRGHAVILTGVTAELENGTREEKIKGIGGVELLREPSTPDGRYGVRVGIEAAPENAQYDYYVVGDRFAP